MKLSEISDPSKYRRGDEFNPRSPDYEEPPEPEDQNDTFTFSWEVLDKNDDPIGEGDLTIDVRGELDYESPRSSAQVYSVISMEVKSFKIDGKTFKSLKEVEAEYGKGAIDPDLIEETIYDKIKAEHGFKISQDAKKAKLL